MAILTVVGSAGRAVNFFLERGSVMGEQPAIGVLAETLRPKLIKGNPEHDQLARLLNEGIKFKILGEFQPKGSNGKVFSQITPLDGSLRGRVLSVCKDHVVIFDAGQKEGPANQPLVEATKLS